MRLSAYFLPTLKENPAEAQIASHRLMLRAGLVRQTSAGIYSCLLYTSPSPRDATLSRMPSSA